MFTRARGILILLLAAGGLAAAAPAANADFGCPQLQDRYPMDGWPEPDHAESKRFCPYIGYPIDYGDAEINLSMIVKSDFDSRTVSAGYNEEERSYGDWIGTEWKSEAGGVYSVNIMFYIPSWADDGGVGYTCRYSGSVSGTTGWGHWTYQLDQTTCSTYISTW